MYEINALKQEEGSFGFSFQEQLPGDLTRIKYIGREERTSTDYYWDGLLREKDTNFIFQYTLSGSGILELGQTIHPIHPGEAFIVKVPSDHRYYIPSHSEKWDFVFITLQGELAEQCWSFLQDTIGPILRIDPDSKLIRLLLKTYRETVDRKITDAYHASARGYEFIMECYRFAKKLEKTKALPVHVAQAVSFIQTNFHHPITLNDMAKASSLSKYYLIKQFNEYLHATPIQFLTKIRIEQATQLLLNTNLPIKKIATEVGFSNDNYFNKVFQKMMGMSAGTFRQCKTPINHIIFD
ncbi:AraC family transcriptional regulator [Paludifilum halophilum]|uniref:AraC family transcriptional regulator n=1 Tax=Paludifilum halophilum TaxID=1642702 RepID=UPI00146A9D79|nr:AraC family transcriptional regulator [Paludifilum halophilum]